MLNRECQAACENEISCICWNDALFCCLRRLGSRLCKKGRWFYSPFVSFFSVVRPKWFPHPLLNLFPTSPPSSLTEKPILLPDLTLSNITTDESGKLVIVLSNIGKTLVSSPFGKLKIYVDDDLRWSIPLDGISDQAFLQPGGVTRYTTPVELEGTHSVRAIIDSDDEILEENESNNILNNKSEL